MMRRLCATDMRCLPVSDADGLRDKKETEAVPRRRRKWRRNRMPVLCRWSMPNSSPYSRGGISGGADADGNGRGDSRLSRTVR